MFGSVRGRRRQKHGRHIVAPPGNKRYIEKTNRNLNIRRNGPTQRKSNKFNLNNHNNQEARNYEAGV